MFCWITASCMFGRANRYTWYHCYQCHGSDVKSSGTWQEVAQMFRLFPISARRYHQQSKSLQLGCSRNIWAISTFTDWSIENRDSDIFFFEVLQKQSKKFLVPSIQGFFATGQLYYLRSVWTNPRLWRQTQQETHPIESPILESWSSNHQKSHIHLNIHITTSQLLEIAIHLLVKIKHK